MKTKKVKINKNSNIANSPGGVIFGKPEQFGRIIKNPKKSVHRVMVGVPVTGLVRAEWMVARYGQTLPCNWSQIDVLQFLDQWSPLEYTVADARNIIASAAVEQNVEWLFFVDHDTILPPGTVLKMNERMIQKKVPIVSGLYFTKSIPAEPLIYRGAGNGYYDKWMFGDDVWVSAVPMGCTLIHVSILKALYEESEAYQMGDIVVRKIFETPAKIYLDPEIMRHSQFSGTEDISFCNRIVRDNIFKKAGWPKYEKMEFPFLIDTSIFCKHIDMNGIQYPTRGEEFRFLPKNLGTMSQAKFMNELRNRFNMLPK